jgi:solute carrier family 12 sodium/potassium/chloride transporter 2
MFYQDPQGSIPKGTILSIVLTTISYVGMAIMAGAVMVRDASGNVTELVNGTFTDCTYRECRWGLHNSFQVSSRYVCSCSFFTHEIYCMLLVA